MTFTVDKLSFSYGGEELLKNISFSLAEGEIATLIGASGSGKTTLFKLITGILPLERGLICIDGKPLEKADGKVSFMMQEDLLLPWRNVLKNILLPSELGQKKTNKKQALKEAEDLLLEVELAEAKSLFPRQLSGGMRQRVSLARALLQKKPLLLLDEPFNALDVLLREQMYALLRRINKSRKTTMLMVTHDFRDAVSLSDRIFLLSKGSLSHQWKITAALRNDPHLAADLVEEMRRNLL